MKPGSQEALDAGCLCPVLDNNHGKWAPYPPDGWWMNQKCPIHGLKRECAPAPRPNKEAE